MLKQTDTKAVYDVIAKRGIQGNTLISQIVANITSNEPIDFAKEYRKAYEKQIKLYIDSAKVYLEYDIDELHKYETGYYSSMDKDVAAAYAQQRKNKIDKSSKFIEKMSAQKTLADYDKNLDETIRRHSKRLEIKYNAWRDKVSKQPGFDKLVQQLRTLVMQEQVRNVGRDDF